MCHPVPSLPLDRHHQSKPDSALAPWLPKVQPEVEDLEPAAPCAGQQAAEKHTLGRLQYSLDYDFQSGQVGVVCGSILGSQLPPGRRELR